MTGMIALFVGIGARIIAGQVRFIPITKKGRAWFRYVGVRGRANALQLTAKSRCAAA
jgi:hypothetical protein